MQILVVDDSRLIREMVGAIIAAEGYVPYKGENAKQALDILNEVDIDLILMDVEMPDVNGFELTKMIREAQEEWIPIIFLSGQTTDAHLSQGIDAGGDDYLLKPVNSIVLSAKIRAMSRIAKMKADLDEANHNLLKLTHLDPLTETVNRRGLDESLKRYLRMSLRDKTVLSLVFIDIDHFKPYNDNYGHQQGDDCLRKFCKVIEQVLHRPLDMLARFGGEEFVVLLPQTASDGAELICKDIITALATTNIEHKYSNTKPYLTASLGIATTDDGARESKQLLEQADKALYQAKHSGRNKWVCYTDTY